MAAVLDTHAAIWYLLRSPNLSSNAFRVVEDAARSDEQVFLPSISLVEVVYLVEKGRLPLFALERPSKALSDPSAALTIAPLDLAVAESVQRIPRESVPDTPDRIIGATALHLDLPLITRDHRVQTARIKTIW